MAKKRKPEDTTPFLGDQTRRHYWGSPVPVPKGGADRSFDFPQALS